MTSPPETVSGGIVVAAVEVTGGVVVAAAEVTGGVVVSVDVVAVAHADIASKAVSHGRIQRAIALLSLHPRWIVCLEEIHQPSETVRTATSCPPACRIA